ncbi:MAG: Sec-independent protein translocase protein TatB [Pseudomonadota bacterium]
MFDIGFSELFLIAIVALVVLGPERLPKAARFAGLWVRRARAQWYSVRSELERELATEELQRTLRDTRKAVTDIGEDMRAAETEARREFDTMQSQIAAGTAYDGSSDIDDSTALLDSDDKALLAAIDDIEMRHDLPSDDSASAGSRDVRR